jgi:hypothetical protein
MGILSSNLNEDLRIKPNDAAAVLKRPALKLDLHVWGEFIGGTGIIFRSAATGSVGLLKKELRYASL